MSLEQIIQNAYLESVNGVRRGDTGEEVEEIREYIRRSRVIVVPNCSGEKFSAINEVLVAFGLPMAEHLSFHTDACDLSRMPALTKGLMALDLTSAALVIARGRLGVPGSGSMLVILDQKGRILSASLSPPHIIHGNSVRDAVIGELTLALQRLGFVAHGPEKTG